ncbi:hypothetical protein ES708_22367 [subsurface metagenome]
MRDLESLKVINEFFREEKKVARLKKQKSKYMGQTSPINRKKKKQKKKSKVR